MVSTLLYQRFRELEATKPAEFNRYGKNLMRHIIPKESWATGKRSGFLRSPALPPFDRAGFTHSMAQFRISVSQVASWPHTHISFVPPMEMECRYKYRTLSRQHCKVQSKRHEMRNRIGMVRIVMIHFGRAKRLRMQ